MSASDPATWCGRVNPELPAAPTDAYPSTRLFRDPAARLTYWLPDEPAVHFPALQAFWRGMSKGITAYRMLQTIPGPIIASAPTDGSVVGDVVRLGSASRESRSPNWSGAACAATGGNTLTQVVGRWVEPPFDTAGQFNLNDEFRSSIWIGFNGHAAYLDASLPQIGTMQRIVYDQANNGWVSSRLAWFEWWANVKGREAQELVKPVYLNLNLQQGDAVWCRVDLIPSGMADFPLVARMCMCVDRPASGSTPASKVLVMPFIVYPPRQGDAWSRVSGSTANWITELPKNIEGGPPFLLPRFGLAGAADRRVNFTDCVAGSATQAGEALLAEHTLEVSKRFHLFSKEPRGHPSLARIATCQVPRTSDTEFSIQVDGNDG